MNNFWARFEEIDGSIYRWDTRIYIKPVNDTQGSDICLGAIVGKNPGSAKGKVNIGLQEIKGCMKNYKKKIKKFYIIIHSRLFGKALELEFHS